MDIESRVITRPIKGESKLSYITHTFLSFLFILAVWTTVTDTVKWSLFEIFLLSVHPASLLYTYHKLNCHTFVPLDSAWRVFAAGFLPGALLAASWEHTSKMLLYVLFGATSTVPNKSMMSNLIFLIFMSYGTTSMVEELFKMGVARSKSVACCFNVIRRDRIKMTPRVFSLATMILTTAGAAGFATIENIVYFGIPCKLINICPKDQPIHPSIQTMLYRTLVPASLHIICGIITGVHVARRDHKTANRSILTILQVIMPAVLVHGTYDFCVHLVAVWSAMWFVGLTTLLFSGIVLMYGIHELRNDLRKPSYFNKKRNELKDTLLSSCAGINSDINNANVVVTTRNSLDVPYTMKMTRTPSRTLRRLSLV
jgi:RsiW-degrading membrane proteinase PrsW (M82 family)